MTQTKTIGIFGGSFDPPHLSHQLMALSFLALEPLTELWVVPCADHPFAKNLTPFEQRLKMCKLAFSWLQNVTVSDFESKLQGPSFTVNTLREIKKQNPDVHLKFVLGSDLIHDINRWHEVESLSALCEVVVFLREGFPLKQLPDCIKNAKIYDDFVLPDIRSRKIRSALAKRALPEHMDRSVLSYIKSNKLYT